MTILLVTVRQWKPTGVDVRLTCDDSEAFNKIIGSIEGTWHYVKPNWAYKTLKAKPNESPLDVFLRFFEEKIKPNENEHLITPKILFEAIQGVNPTTEQAKARVSAFETMRSIAIHKLNNYVIK